MDTNTQAIIDTWLQVRDGSRLPNETAAVTFCQATNEIGEWLRAYQPATTFAYVAENLPLLPLLPPEIQPAVALTTYRQMGQCAFLLGKSAVSRSYCDRAHRLSVRRTSLVNPVELVHLYHLQGGVAIEQQSPNGVMPALKVSLTYCTETGNRRKQISILHTLSGYYGRTHRPAEALEVLQEALMLDTAQVAHPFIRIIVHVNLAWAYFDLNQINNALDTITIALHLAYTLNHTLGMGIAHASIGHFLNRKGDYCEAYRHFRSAVSLLDQETYQRNRKKHWRAMEFAHSRCTQTMSLAEFPMQ